MYTSFDITPLLLPSYLDEDRGEVRRILTRPADATGMQAAGVVYALVEAMPTGPGHLDISRDALTHLPTPPVRCLDITSPLPGVPAHSLLILCGDRSVLVGLPMAAGSVRILPVVLRIARMVETDGRAIWLDTAPSESGLPELAGWTVARGQASSPSGWAGLPEPVRRQISGEVSCWASLIPDLPVLVRPDPDMPMTGYLDSGAARAWPAFLPLDGPGDSTKESLARHVRDVGEAILAWEPDAGQANIMVWAGYPLQGSRVPAHVTVSWDPGFPDRAMLNTAVMKGVFGPVSGWRPDLLIAQRLRPDSGRMARQPITLVNELVTAPTSGHRKLSLMDRFPRSTLGLGPGAAPQPACRVAAG